MHFVWYSIKCYLGSLNIFQSLTMFFWWQSNTIHLSSCLRSDWNGLILTISNFSWDHKLSQQRKTILHVKAVSNWYLDEKWAHIKRMPIMPNDHRFYLSNTCTLPTPLVVTIAHFFSSFLYSFASLFILLLVERLISIINVSFTLFHPNFFRSNYPSLEYSPQNIPLYYLTFHWFLSHSILFVIPLTINVYKLHNSLLSFPMLVYLVLLASIDPLVTSSGFRQVSTLLLTRHFLFESLNLWSISVWVAMLKTLQHPPVLSLQEEPLILQGLCSSLPRPSVTLVIFTEIIWLIQYQVTSNSVSIIPMVLLWLDSCW